ncbi:MAG: DUF115 domain-containing protein, partial [Candidatus Helarchaeota archaeon]|nr:DUF115 domain-containing protein [Candidatus Helarchaeota archaeon]
HERRNYINIKDLKNLIRNKVIFIYGCGPSLPNQLKNLKNSLLPLGNFTHISADGATTALLEYNIIPNIIITDLDGQISDLIDANKKGALIIIHAHGDNIEAIHQYFSLFPGKMMGTTQNKPLPFLKNYGGFTDGDRCIYLAEEMGASLIVLFGFDFGNIIGKYSKPHLNHDDFADEIKLQKLHWAQILITELSINSKTTIIRLNGKKLKLGKVKNYKFEELLKYLMKPLK